tara:strand:+ start:103 stop:1749 length:1647 start_codon:yes stop_codon:yes gene_type:complete
MPKAISYMRFSAIHQGKGSTLERQKELIEEWFHHHPDIKRSNLSSIDYGKSGFTGKDQHGLDKIRAAVEMGKILVGDYILVEAMDRLGRLQPLKMIELITSIVNRGVVIVTLEDGQEYSQNTLNNNPSCLYILAGKVQQAHDYSKQLSRRILKAYERKRRLAREGGSISLHTPVWLTSKGKLDPVKSEMVKECISLYLKGYGARRVILDLIPKYPDLSKVHPSTFKKWFTNRVIIGEWDTLGERIPNVFEPLIDLPTFYRLQKELDYRRRVMSPEKTYQLSGLVVCGECEGKYHFRRKKHKDFTIIYSNCSTYLKRGSHFCTNKMSFPYEVLKYVYDITCGSTVAKNVFDNYSSQKSSKVEEINIQLKEKNEEINKFLELASSIPNLSNLKDKLSKLNEEKEKIVAQLIAIEAELDDSGDFTESDYGHMNYLIEEYQNDHIQKRDMLAKVGYKIKVIGNKVEMVEGFSHKEIFTLVKRSQKLGCYLVEQCFLACSIRCGEQDGVFNWFPDHTRKLAINRDGLMAMSDDDINWDVFITNFEKYKVPINN